VVSVRAFNDVGKGPVVYDLVYTSDTPAGKTLHALVCLGETYSYMFELDGINRNIRTV